MINNIKALHREMSKDYCIMSRTALLCLLAERMNRKGETHYVDEFSNLCPIPDGFEIHYVINGRVST